jgi:hypothetical protein
MSVITTPTFFTQQHITAQIPVFSAVNAVSCA